MFTAWGVSGTGIINLLAMDAHAGGKLCSGLADVNNSVTTYNPKHFNIFQEAKKNFSIIERDQELQQLIKKSDLLHSQREPLNKKKILTRARFHSTPEK